MKRYWLYILLAALVAVPGIVLSLTGTFHHWIEPAVGPAHPYYAAILAGVAILGASFLLLWACDAAQMDIPQTLALAVVALIAVLPEYAVDMYFTWQAGQGDAQAAHYAIANMTGANRLLIGVAWALIAVIFWFKTRKAVRLEKDRRTEILFLGMATLYAFFVALKGSLEWYDGIVFLALYGWYIALASRRPCVECELEGPAEVLMHLPTVKRRWATIGMFLFSAAAIGVCAEPFSKGLVVSGTQANINEFLLVQWLAPIASEAPEFIVAIMFALRGQAGLALGSLLSAKLNQWTLLVGMIPGVYALSAGQLHSPIPMDATQMHEILLTAAQSLLAVIMLLTLRLSIGQALLLFGLFLGQLLTGVIPQHYLPFHLNGDGAHQLFAIMYVVAAITLIMETPRRFNGLWQGFRVHIDTPCRDCLPEIPATAEEQEREKVGV